MQIGIDFGGTKIEAAALDRDGNFLERRRIPTPGTYEDAIRTVRDLVAAVEQGTGEASVGVGSPGSISPATGTMHNANTVYLNGRRFREDLETALARPVRLANDANCMALSEVVDGAAAGAGSAFAVIIGTGCGGGLVVDGKIVAGGHGVAGEWGHVPLPWLSADEYPGPACWCGKQGCLERWISGTGFAEDHRAVTGEALGGPAIVDAARRGDPAASASLERYVDRLGRAIGMISTILDPEVFVLAGGMSNVTELYDCLPAVVGRHTFTPDWPARIVPARWGDASGVRGAARLWPLEVELPG